MFDAPAHTRQSLFGHPGHGAAAGTAVRRTMGLLPLAPAAGWEVGAFSGAYYHVPAAGRPSAVQGVCAYCPNEARHYGPRTGCLGTEAMVKNVVLCPLGSNGHNGGQ